MRDIPGPTPGQEVTTPSSAGEAAAASADTSSHSTRHFACDLTMHSASLIPLSIRANCAGALASEQQAGPPCRRCMAAPSRAKPEQPVGGRTACCCRRGGVRGFMRMSGGAAALLPAARASRIATA